MVAMFGVGPKFRLTADGGFLQDERVSIGRVADDHDAVVGI